MDFLLLSVLVIVLQFEIMVSLSMKTSNSKNSMCPPWTKLVTNEINGTCECREKLSEFIYCSKSTHNVSVLIYHCMTYNDAKHKVLVGHCAFNYFARPSYSDETYLHKQISNFKNLSELNSNMCQNFRRIGQMCGSCEPDYSPPVHSYRLECVKCKHYKNNWLKYLALAFLPLTVFYIIVILFRITITSGAMNGYILASQILACPSQVRLFVIASSPMPSYRTEFKILTLFYGLWNLDVFRGVQTHSFCLHPKMTTLQVLAMDYLVAVYPLMLIVVTYVCVKLHDRYSIVIRMWKPFYWCFARIRREWDISKSLIGAFATFLLLSYVKILYISSDFLAPNILYYVTGNKYPKLYLNYDGTYEYFGKEHLPYALLAIVMVTVFNVIPLVLLALYPCKCFQRCLNHCWPQRELFRTFAETFQGPYKLKPYDCRYFVPLYLLLRFIVLIMYGVLRAPAYYPIVAITFFFAAAIVALARPYKSTLHTIIDILFLLLTGMAFIWEPVYTAIQTLEPRDIPLMNYIIGIIFIPPLYGTLIVSYHLIPKKYHTKIVNCFKKMMRRKNEENDDFLSYRTKQYIESSPLLQGQKLLAINNLEN